MAYSGKFRPSNPKKYRGNPTRIIYRSMWEKKFMIFCDRTKSIVEWGSEEIIIPYRCPTDGKVHRYYPDFYIKVLNKDGKYKKWKLDGIAARVVQHEIDHLEGILFVDYLDAKEN